MVSRPFSFSSKATGRRRFAPYLLLWLASFFILFCVFITNGFGPGTDFQFFTGPLTPSVVAVASFIFAPAWPLSRQAFLFQPGSLGSLTLSWQPSGLQVLRQPKPHLCLFPGSPTGCLPLELKHALPLSPTCSHQKPTPVSKVQLGVGSSDLVDVLS